MNTPRDITQNTHLLRESVQEKYSTGRSPKQYVMTTQLSSKERKKMRITKMLTSIIGVCLIPITGLVFMQKADATTIPVWGSKSPGKCGVYIYVSSSGRDTWYWEVECGRKASRKAYLAAKKACNYDFEMRQSTHYDPFATDLIEPYVHNKCY